MPVHPTKRCSKCFHPRPYGRRTWQPFWSWFEEAGGPRLTYAADGPPLGYVMECATATGTRYYRAWVLSARPERGKAWPKMNEVTLKRGAQREGVRAIEVAVREHELWNPKRCP